MAALQVLPPQLAQCPDFLAGERVRAIDTVLGPPHMDAAAIKLDHVPSQFAKLAGTEPMAVGDQDHGRIAMPVAAVLARAVHQPLDLALGEVAPLDCQVYDAWCAFLGCRFHRGKTFLLAVE